MSSNLDQNTQTNKRDTSQFNNIKKFAYNLLEVSIRAERGDEYCLRFLKEVRFPRDE